MRNRTLVLNKIKTILLIFKSRMKVFAISSSLQEYLNIELGQRYMSHPHIHEYVRDFAIT